MGHVDQTVALAFDPELAERVALRSMMRPRPLPLDIPDPEEPLVARGAGITGWTRASGLRGPAGDNGRARASTDGDIAPIQNFSFGLISKSLLRPLRHEFVGGSADYKFF